MPIGGAVTLLSREAIWGWVIDTDSDVLPVVDVFLDGHKVRTLRLTSKMKGFEDFPCKGLARFKFRVTPSFAVYVNTKKSLEFRVGDKVLPVLENTYKVAAKARRKPLSEFLELKEKGWIVTKQGKFRLSVHLDTEWQEKVLQFYERARTYFKENHDLELPIAYGTLLGHTRQGGFIPGDDDFDTAYISKQTDAASVKREMIAIMRDLVARGETIKLAKRKCFFHWADTELGVTLDIFPAWCEGPMFYQAFAVGAPCADAIRAGFTEETMGGKTVLVPREKETIVAATYGPQWRTPDPMFQWVVSPEVGAVMSGLKLTEVEANEIYWDRNYRNVGSNPPSTFAESVRDKVPADIKGVIDLGCGSGRDTAHVANGRPALGLDYAFTAITANRERVKEEGLTNVSFEQSDVRETAALTDTIRSFANNVGGPIALYSRFFLHSIDDEGEKSVLDALSNALPKGSVVFFEFRTHLDEFLEKKHGGHFRRFVKPDDFVKRVIQYKTFEVVSRQEGQGLAPYKDEDPHVARFELRKI